MTFQACESVEPECATGREVEPVGTRAGQARDGNERCPAFVEPQQADVAGEPQRAIGREAHRFGLALTQFGTATDRKITQHAARREIALLHARTGRRHPQVPPVRRRQQMVDHAVLGGVTIRAGRPTAHRAARVDVQQRARCRQPQPARAVLGDGADAQPRQRIPDALTLDAALLFPIARGLAIEVRGENLTDAEVVAGISGVGIVERATPRTLWLGLIWQG